MSPGAVRWYVTHRIRHASEGGVTCGAFCLTADPEGNEFCVELSVGERAGQA